MPRLHALLRRPLLYPLVVSALLYVALLLLLQSRSFRLSQTLALRRWPQLNELADRLTPDAFVKTPWTSPQAGTNELLYALTVLALVVMWGWALWLVRPGARTVALPLVLGGILLFAAPLILLPGMFSGDVYLYMFYGRTIAHYGENPILSAPINFAGDPHLNWVYWKKLPSAYGPVWLMYSGVLSALAGNALFANVFTYKAGVLLLHLLTTAVVWSLLKGTTPGLASWGAIFYGWNPLVLFETVGSAHNEVMAVLFVALCLLAVMRKHWLFAVFFLTAGAMVKLTVLILLTLLLLGWLRELPERWARARAVVAAVVVAVASGAALYAPLWGGVSLLENIRENPAATRYQNTLWELFALRLAGSPDKAVLESIQHDLSPLRNALFAVLFLWLAWRLWNGANLAGTLALTWVAYCATAAYAWPWYFVLPIGVAAVCGPGRVAALAGGLTVGGLLFWLGWPDPPLPAAPWLYHYRSVLLFLPPVLLLLWPVVRLRARTVRRGQAVMQP